MDENKSKKGDPSIIPICTTVGSKNEFVVKCTKPPKLDNSYIPAHRGIVTTYFLLVLAEYAYIGKGFKKHGKALFSLLIFLILLVLSPVWPFVLVYFKTRARGVKRDKQNQDR